jgi:quercetin dioxygenase-like cupin family protein
MSAHVSAVGDRLRLVLIVVVATVAVTGLFGLALFARPSESRPAGRGVLAAQAGAVRQPPIVPNSSPRRAWGDDIKVRVPFQQPIDRLPDGAPYVMRVTELEMEPGAKIYEHRQLGVGAHVVVRGSMTIENLDSGEAKTYESGQAYYEGLGPLHRAENRGPQMNRVVMVDILPASRGFDGTQEFTAPGRHNEGGLRSGPYVQIPLGELPPGELMLRVSDMTFGPKAKMVEHTRLGPAIFFVQEGTATVRKDWDNSSQTYGTDGYFFEDGREPLILENKPAKPARFLAIELLPTSVGDQPSTVPTAS